MKTGLAKVLPWKTTATSGQHFKKLLERIKTNRNRITSEFVLEFVRIRSQAKELSEQKKILAEKFKRMMLKTKQDEIAFDDCPWMLRLVVTDPKPIVTTNYEKIAANLAKQLYGKGYRSDKRFKALVTRYKEVEYPEPVAVLQEPVANPNYQKARL